MSPRPTILLPISIPIPITTDNTPAPPMSHPSTPAVPTVTRINPLLGVIMPVIQVLGGSRGSFGGFVKTQRVGGRPGGRQESQAFVQRVDSSRKGEVSLGRDAYSIQVIGLTFSDGETDEPLSVLLRWSFVVDAVMLLVPDSVRIPSISTALFLTRTNEETDKKA